MLAEDWPDGVFDQTASGFPVTGFGTMVQSARAGCAVPRTIRRAKQAVRVAAERRSGVVLFVLMLSAPGLPASLCQPGVERSSFLGTLFQSYAVLSRNGFVLGFLGAGPSLLCQLPEVEGAMKDFI